MGPLLLTSRGNKYILVFTDIFSKWVEAFPIQSTDTETLAILLVNVIMGLLYLFTVTKTQTLLANLWQLYVTYLALLSRPIQVPIIHRAKGK